MIDINFIPSLFFWVSAALIATAIIIMNISLIIQWNTCVQWHDICNRFDHNIPEECAKIDKEMDRIKRRDKRATVIFDAAIKLIAGGVGFIVIGCICAIIICR